ncbi:MAG: hypothetical protein AAFY02_08420 [Pseudomonadota bacterium]
MNQLRDLGATALLAGFAIATALIAVEPIGRWVLAAFGLPTEPRWSDDWLAERARLILAAWIPLGLAGLLGLLGWQGRAWPTALLAAAALAAYPLGLLLPWISQGLATIIAFALMIWAAWRLRYAGNSGPAASPREKGTAQGWLWLIGTIAATAALRSLTYEEAFERDLMVYITVAELWLNGAPLYAEAWDHKPPGVHIVYLLAIWLFGVKPAAIYALGLSCSALTAAGILVGARRLGGRAAIPPALLLWFAFGNDPLIAANQPNVEALIAPCLAWSLALIVGRQQEGLKGRLTLGRRAWGLGLLFFLATLFKQILVFVPLCLALAIFVQAATAQRPERPAAVRSACRDVGSLALVGLAGWLSVFAIFTLWGDLTAFYQAVFAFNQDYAGGIAENVARGFGIAIRAPSAYPYVVAACLLGLIGLLHWREPRQILTAALLLGIGLAIFAPGRYFYHYYQLLTPFLALFGGALIAGFVQGWRSWLLAAAAAAFALSAFVYYDPDRLPLVKHAGHGLESLESKALGQRLALDLPPEARFYHWGAEPGLYFWSGQPAPLGFVYSYPLLQDARPAAFDTRALAQLEALDPTLIVAKTTTLAREHLLSDWITTHYRSTHRYGDYETFTILVPRN